jgi:hypothetical protein
VLVGYDNEKRAYRIWCPFFKEFYTSRDVRFDETTRGYHGGANYREEQSRPDDWNVVEWSNAMSFKPTTEPDSPTEHTRAPSQSRKATVGTTKTMNKGSFSERNRSKASNDEMDAVADQKEQENSSSDDEEKAMERGDFMSESEHQDGDKYSDSDHSGVLRDTSQVQRTTPERRTFRNDQNRKVGFLDQKHHKAPISRRGSDADGTGASQTNQASDSDETKKISTKKVHPSLQKQDLKTKNSMSDISSSCSHNYSSDFKAPADIRRSSRQRAPTIRGLESIASSSNLGFIEDYSFCGLSSITMSDAQATADPNWRGARDAEINSLKDLQSFRVVKRESRMKVIPTRWVY